MEGLSAITARELRFLKPSSMAKWKNKIKRVLEEKETETAIWSAMTILSLSSSLNHV